MSVITYPQFVEVDFLLNKYHLKKVIVDKAIIKESINCIRKANGTFEESHFKAVIQLLENEWLPNDIPVLLPPPSQILDV